MSAPAGNPLDELKPRQRKFVERYCIHLNASRAAREAGYKAGRPDQIGYENLRKPEIKAAIRAVLDQIAMSNEEALTRLTDWARGSVEPFVDENGNLALDTAIAKEHYHLIKKVKQTRRVVAGKDDAVDAEIISTEIELHDAKDAVVKLLEANGRLKAGGDQNTSVTIFQLPDNGR